MKTSQNFYERNFFQAIYYEVKYYGTSIVYNLKRGPKGAVIHVCYAFVRFIILGVPLKNVEGNYICIAIVS